MNIYFSMEEKSPKKFGQYWPISPINSNIGDIQSRWIYWANSREGIKEMEILFTGHFRIPIYSTFHLSFCYAE